MNNQTTFKINIGEQETTIRVEKPNPFVLGDITSRNSARNGAVEVGSYLKDLIKANIIISPKNLEERIIENGDINDIVKIISECNKFFKEPSLHKLKQREQTKSDSVGNNLQHQSDEEANNENE